MSMFESRDYRWRETYFVLFKAQKRPKLKKMQQVLGELSDHYTLQNPTGDDEGRLESLTLISPDDFAALDICYVEGEEVAEQVSGLLKELKSAELGEKGPKQLKRLADCNARLDVLHFEQIADEEEDEEEVLDPTALLLVLAALAKATDGLAIDPQSGTILDEE
ncbi:MAG: hypothetical protein ACOY3P_22500 [Planctomycetota bacterium]